MQNNDKVKMNPNKLKLIHELANSIADDKRSGFSESTLADATLGLIKAYQELQKEKESLREEKEFWKLYAPDWAIEKHGSIFE